MTDYVYSENEHCENWRCEEEDEALEEAFGDGSMPLGESDVTIYRGVKRPVEVSEIIPDIYDEMRERSFDNFPEDFDWEIPNEKQQELQELVESAIVEFVKKNNLEPTCYWVDKIEPITIRVRCTNDSWERVTP